MNDIKLYTMGFGQKTAKKFFSLLLQNSIAKLIDVRLNNVSQLAGFTKRDDLAYFLEKICNCDYEHRPDWAPTKELLDGYKSKKIDWPTYEQEFVQIIRQRNISGSVNPESLDMACLLCSEPLPEQCHRRLVAEYFKRQLGNLTIIHLL